MKKLFEEDDHEQDKMERARILMAVIPVVLILLILARSEERRVGKECL